MNVIIFGATGSIGRHLVEQALAQGHRVTAFARTPATLGIDHPRLRPLAGDVREPAAVADAIAGQDAVLVSLGSGRTGTVRSVGTRHVVAGMQCHSVERLICQTTLGCGDSWANLDFFWKRIMFGAFLRAAFADHQRQEEWVRASELDWTLVRPAAFVDGPATGTYRHGFPSTERRITLKISRADVAGFMLEQLDSDRYRHQAPGLSY